MSTGSNIKTLRIAKGLTQKQLGDLCGMADSAIRRLESDTGNPTEKTLRRVADALGVSIAELNKDNDLFDTMKSMSRYFGHGVWLPPYVDQSKADEIIDSVLDINARYNSGDRKAQLVVAFDRLNDMGQQKALECVEELTEIPRYQRQDATETPPAPPAPPAPPESTDTTSPQSPSEGS